MADNNSTASATEEEVGAVENSAPESVEETAAPSAPTNSVSAPSLPIVQRVGTDLTPDLKPLEENETLVEVENGRAYEITFIVIANNPTALDSSQASVKALIEEGQGAVDNVRVSEVRRLSYPIAKRTEGIYVVFNARFPKALTTDLERHFKLDENVLRHVILRENA